MDELAQTLSPASIYALAAHPNWLESPVNSGLLESARAAGVTVHDDMESTTCEVSAGPRPGAIN